MTTVEIKRSAVGKLHPARRSITDGGLDCSAKTFTSRGLDGLTLQLDGAALARFRWYERGALIPSILALATLGAAAWWYANPDTYMEAHAAVLAPLATAVGFLFPAVYSSYLAPRGYPKRSIIRPVIRLRNVDDAAAAEWQAANPDGVMVLKPDSSIENAIVKHALPILLIVTIVLLVNALR